MMDKKAYEQALAEAAEQMGMAVPDDRMRDILAYIEHLLDVNESLNLTRIIEPADVAVKHFADSWTLLPLLDSLPDKRLRLLDIGTGAGFPGFALKLLRPDIALSVIESIEKKVRFLQAANERLGLDANVLHGRAEELAHDPGCRAQFDVVTARAVAALDMLVELALPFVKKGGIFIAMRGQEEDIPNSLQALGATLREIRPLVLPGDITRTLYVFRKVSGTPDSLPRSMHKIRKRPL